VKVGLYDFKVGVYAKSAAKRRRSVFIAIPVMLRVLDLLGKLRRSDPRVSMNPCR
jgi:hypothetical protein